MSVTTAEIDRLKKVIVRYTKRRNRWVEKRDRRCLQLALEGKDTKYMRQHYCSWEITHAERQIAKAKASLEALRCAP